MAKIRGWAQLLPGDTLCDMHDGMPSRLPIAEEHTIKSVIRIRTPGGDALIEAAVREAADPDFRYVNKYLTVLDIQDERIIAAWSYDDLQFGIVEIHIRNP